MRFNRLYLSEEITKQVGLAEIKIERLGSIIALVGKNGSGKTRILDLLENYYLNELKYENYFTGELDNVPKNLEEAANQINSIIKEIQEKSDPDIKNIEDLKKQIEAIRPKPGTASNNANRIKRRELQDKVNSLQQNADIIKNLEAQRTSLNQNLEVLHKKYFHRIKSSEIRNLQAVLDSASMDKKTVTFEDLIDAAIQQEDYNELDAIYKSGLEFLAKMPNLMYDDFIRARGKEEKFEKTQSRKRFHLLAKYIKIFLNKDLDWDIGEFESTVTRSGVTSKVQGLWKLYDRIFDYKELSDGEKTLFTYSLLFFLIDQNSKLRIQESIILIDEPELHLHPEAEIKIIEKISELVRNQGQLWIATHSISILSGLTYDEIFMVKSGKITSPSKTTPGESLNELMGLEVHLDKLNHFLADISQWAFLNYMTQCFNDPDVIKCAQENDPEFEVFKKFLKEKETPSILLDFGAGQGRIYREIAKDEEVASKIQYSALEPDEKNSSELKSLGIPVYNNYSDLQENTFDIIWLCNVLHEINISEWQSTLNKLRASLSENGYLIIVEDLKLPRGEKIEEAGFIILDLESITKLFSLTSLPIQIIPDAEKYKDRILCTVISKRSMQDATASSILDSLNTLRENVLEKIKKNRTIPITNENKLVLGRESALYSQLYINSLIATEIISSGKSEEITV